MIGAIAGDVIGSAYEGAAPLEKDFVLLGAASRFTDDTVLTVAVAHALRTGADYATALRQWGMRYPAAGYGGMFLEWLDAAEPKPYGSFGNGSAMRVSAVGWAHSGLESVLREAERSAAVTHDHPEGVRGACATAAAVFAARHGATKDQLRELFTGTFGYDCSETVAQRWVRGGFDVTCQGTVPAAMVAVLESRSFVDAVRNAVSMGGDTDTTACIAGAIAEALYGGVPADLALAVLARLDAPLLVEVVTFATLHGIALPPELDPRGPLWRDVTPPGA